MNRRKISLVLVVPFAVMVSTAMAQPVAKTPDVTEPALVAKGGRVLSGADFKTIYVGNTLTGTTSDGEAFHVFVASASQYRMHFQGKVTEDRWTIGTGGEFCAVSGGDTSCTREVLADQTIYSFNPDGSLAGTARIRPGNPERL